MIKSKSGRFIMKRMPLPAAISDDQKEMTAMEEQRGRGGAGSMKLELRRDLDALDAVFDHGFVFDAHARDRRVLITRYRGTVVRPSDAGFTVVAWQKSVYHFGGLNREVPVLATVLLDPDGVVRGLSLDERCLGSQGKRCDFRTLQICMDGMLKGKPFSDFGTHCPDAGAARCLHLFEVLDGAAGFFALLRSRGLAEGSEQELVTIRPNRGGLKAENRHILLGRESVTELELRHIDPTRRNERDLTCHVHADVTVRHQGGEAFRQTLCADRFEDVYTALNLLFVRCYQLDKKALELPVHRRVRFTNWSALAGLFLLTFSHESMAGAVLRAVRIERMLHFIQTGEGRTGCIGFGG